MANIDNAIGLVPVHQARGGESRCGEYTIPSGYDTALGAGDPMALVGPGEDVEKAAPGSTLNIGMFVGVRYTDVNGMPVFSEYWPANTVTKGAKAAVVTVLDQPGEVYRMQCDELNEDDTQRLADWDTGAPSEVTRLSGAELVASASAAAGKSIRILKLSDIPNNAYGVHAVADVEFASHVKVTAIAGAGGVGV